MMTSEMQELFTRTDHFFADQLMDEPADLARARAQAREAGLPEIEISPLQAQFLYLTALNIGAQRILEIGTLGGYSALWLARALPEDGTLITLEKDPKCVAAARSAFQASPRGKRITLMQGPALKSLAQIEERIEERSEPPFDLVFMDADKSGYPGYFAHALKLLRPGGLIIADNVVRGGHIANAEDESATIRGLRHFIADVAADPGVQATVLPLADRKGYDGMMVVRVNKKDEAGT